MKRTVENYCDKYKNLSHTQLAEIIVKDGETNLSKRTLRRKISEHRNRFSSKYETQAVGELSYKGEKSITSLKEAIDFFDINTKKYNIKKYTVNSWDVAGKNGKRTNYQVKVSLEPKEVGVNTKRIKSLLEKEIKNFKPKEVKGSEVGVLAITDLHIGAKVSGLKNTPDFSYKVVIERLGEIVSKINRMNYKEVHLVMLGDFIESFTGLNHPNSWKGLEHEAYGAEVIINAYKIINKFISSINNISSVNMVAGNHDRVTSSSKEDVKGDAAKLLHFMLDSNNNLEVNYDPFILTKKIDNVNYILTHNHFGISRNDVGKVCFEYGDQSCYNVLLGGHWHSRKTQKYYKTDNIISDQANYRSIVVAPIFSGNFYSESNGWTSTSGFSLIENNGKDKINVFDYTI
jgi:hypothetical protein